nr:hypothetical protein [Rhodoferax sp.]
MKIDLNHINVCEYVSIEVELSGLRATAAVNTRPNWDATQDSFAKIACY